MKKKILALILAMTCLLSTGFKSPTVDAAGSNTILVPYQPFVDVPFENENSAYISMASLLNIINCNGNDYFKPSSKFTESDLYLALYRITNKKPSSINYKYKSKNTVTMEQVACNIWKNSGCKLSKTNVSNNDQAWEYCTSNGIISSSLQKEKMCSRTEAAIIFVKYYLFLKDVDVRNLSLKSAWLKETVLENNIYIYEHINIKRTTILNEGTKIIRSNSNIFYYDDGKKCYTFCWGRVDQRPSEQPPKYRPSNASDHYK